MKSYKEIVEALKGKQHKIDKNKNGKIDAHDFKLLRKEEAEQLEEGLDPSEVASNPKMYDAATVKKAYYHKSTSAADKEYLAKHLDRHHGNKEWRKPVKEEAELTEATVKTQKYSWGTMKTVHHGADFSIPLHPEHHQAIAKLKDNQEHKFKDETGRHWTAKRDGDKVHLHSANDGPKTTVKHADLKEETIEEAADRMARADYKVSPSGRKSHKEIVFPSSDKEDEKKEMKEEIEELDERNKENATRRKMMDASRGARFKAQGNYVPDAEPEHKTAQAHNKAIGRAIRKMSNEETKKDDDLPFTPDKPKKNPVAKAGKFGIGPSTAKHLAKMGMQQAMKKTVKEEIDLDEEITFTMTVEQFEQLDEGMQQALRKYVPGYAKHQLNKKMDAQAYEKGDSIKKTVDKDVNYGRYKKIADKLKKEEVEIEEQAPVAPVPDKKYIKGTPEYKAYMATKKTRVGHPTSVKEDLDEKIDLAKAKMGDVIKDFQASDAPQFAGKSKEKRREMAIAAKLEADRGVKEDSQLSFKEFMMMLEYEAKGGVYRHTGTYGSEYAKKEREQDEKGFDSEKQSTEKRGRGRPAGAKSGARGPRIK